MLTVRELLDGLDVRLLTGEAGTEMPVRWVHISELLDPTPWLSGGEILLTTGMALTDPGEQRDYIARLADHRLAAVGFGVGLAHPEVPRHLLEAAEERGFSVFEVPFEVPFLAVTESAFTRLVNEQYAVLRRALNAHERLEQVVLSERGIGALAGSLAALLGASVIVLDARGEVLAQHDFRRRLDDDAVRRVADQARERANREESRVFIPDLDDGSGALALAVAAAGRDEGRSAVPDAWLVAVKDSGALSDFDRLTLHQAVTLIALELLRARVAGDTERRLAGDVLAGLSAGDLSGHELARRLAAFELGDRVAAIAVSAEGAGSLVEEALRSALRPDASACLVAMADGYLFALVPALSEPDALAMAGRVGDRLADRLGVPVRVGLGRGVAAADTRRSLYEARYALETLTLGGAELAAGAGGNGNGASAGRARGASQRCSVASYRDIGSFALLLSLQNDESLRVFCDSILEPIESSEGAYGDELIRSLEAFVEENGQWERAAKRLPCHRHTLRYRIRRIEELTGRDLGNARDRIDFWLALRGRELVR